MSEAQAEPGAYAAIVSAAIDDLILFAMAHAAGRTASARAALAQARMRLDELHGKVNPKRRAMSSDHRTEPK